MGVALGGALVTALVFLALVAAAAAIAGRRTGPAARPARARGMSWTGLGPEALVGLRLAVRGHGRAVALSAGAAVAVAGIVAALAFGSGIALLLSDPVRAGQAADLTLEDAEEADVAKLVADPRVAAVAVTRSVTAIVADGGVLPVQASTARKGVVPAGLVSGRLPDGPTEIALSPRVAAQRGLNVGDNVNVVNRNGRPLALTVTGTVAAVDDGGHLGVSNVVTDAALGRLARTAPIVRAQIIAAPGQGGRLSAELGRNLEILPRGTPPEVRNLADLSRLPELLAAALAVIAGAAMAHTLITAARRHTREMAVLAAIGAPPRRSGARWRCSAARSSRPRWCSGCPSASPPPGCSGGRRDVDRGGRRAGGAGRAPDRHGVGGLPARAAAGAGAGVAGHAGVGGDTPWRRLRAPGRGPDGAPEALRTLCVLFAPRRRGAKKPKGCEVGVVAAIRLGA